MLRNIKKTVRLSDKEWEQVQRKMLKSDKNFTEYARACLANKKIKEYSEPYISGFSDLQLIGASIVGTVIFLLLLINTILPIRYISYSDWIIPVDNRVVIGKDKYLRVYADEIIMDKKDTDFRYIKVN